MINVIRTAKRGIKRTRKNVAGFMNRPSRSELEYERDHYKELNKLTVEFINELLKENTRLTSELATKES